MKFKAAIFDMDGLLVDSELHWMKYGSEIWSKLGVRYTEELRRELHGLRIWDQVKLVKEKYHPKLTHAETWRVYGQYRKKVYINKSKLLRGARELLKALEKNGALIALGTSASRMSIDMVMDKYKLRSFFHLIVSAAKLRIPGKPHPAIYKKIIKRLRFQPKQVVIFEDSFSGVKAAKGSGAKVVAVPDKRWSHGDFSIADLVVKSLADKRIYKLLGLNQ